MFSAIWSLLTFKIPFYTGIFVLVCVGIYLAIIIASCFVEPYDLKKRYNTKWALVTGASSGIGLAITERLAKQGINVVLVALDDDYLKTSSQKLKQQYPEVEFRAVGVDLSAIDGSYLDIIKKHTEDIDIGIVVNNAGYIRIGPFDESDYIEHQKHMECNMMSHVRITHYFYAKMKAKKNGVICFTASSVSFLPAPYCILYGATKIFLNEFATSLAVEAAHNNVDITVINPQYTRTNLYENAPKLSIFSFLNLFGSNPSDVADVVMRNLGRVLKRDQGLYSIMMKWVGGFIDVNVMVPLMAFFLKLFPDYKKMNAKKIN